MLTNVPHVVGVDIGTTSTKAVVFDIEGKVKGHQTAYYPLRTPAPGVAEQDPDEIFAFRPSAAVSAPPARRPATSRASASAPPCTASSPSMPMAGR